VIKKDDQAESAALSSTGGVAEVLDIIMQRLGMLRLGMPACTCYTVESLHEACHGYQSPRLASYAPFSYYDSPLW
jgi:hypothetical protein